jgi:hypothetical protein
VRRCPQARLVVTQRALVAGCRRCGIRRVPGDELDHTVDPFALGVAVAGVDERGDLCPPAVDSGGEGTDVGDVAVRAPGEELPSGRAGPMGCRSAPVRARARRVRRLSLAIHAISRACPIFPSSSSGFHIRSNCSSVRSSRLRSRRRRAFHFGSVARPRRPRNSSGAGYLAIDPPLGAGLLIESVNQALGGRGERRQRPMQEHGPLAGRYGEEHQLHRVDEMVGPPRVPARAHAWAAGTVPQTATTGPLQCAPGCPCRRRSCTTGTGRPPSAACARTSRTVRAWSRSGSRRSDTAHPVRWRRVTRPQPGRRSPGRQAPGQLPPVRLPRTSGVLAAEAAPTASTRQHPVNKSRSGRRRLPMAAGAAQPRTATETRALGRSPTVR